MNSRPLKGEPVATPPTAGAPVAGTSTPKPASGDGSVVKDASAAEEDWESERKLVSSLWMLQQMEAKIYQLRTLVPDRLLAPLASIINPNRDESSTPIPKSPQEMFEQLSQAARDGVAEVKSFQAEWCRPEMKEIWDRVDQKWGESGDDYPQPSGMWEQDYDVILKTLDREEKAQEQQREKAREEQERLESISTDGGWRGVVESFMKQDNPGLLITFPQATENPDYFFVLLRKISTMFCIQQGRIVGDERDRAWQVKSVPHGSTSKLEVEILNHISARNRQWDLRYLLDMISSYVDIKQTRCTGCNRLTDINAQLPTFRKPKQIITADEKSAFMWEPYHSGCI